jgi:hypothetical protein
MEPDGWSRSRSKEAKQDVCGVHGRGAGWHPDCLHGLSLAATEATGGKADVLYYAGRRYPIIRDPDAPSAVHALSIMFNNESV